MKRIIKISESELISLIKNILNEGFDYNPHFDDPYTIQDDKDEAWEEIEDFDSNRDNLSAKNPKWAEDYNQNISGEEMRPEWWSQGKYVGYPGLGSDYAMDAMSKGDGVTRDPRYYAQTEMPTERETDKALNKWFPADFDDEQYSDSNYIVKRNGTVNENSVKNYLKKIIKEELQ